VSKGFDVPDPNQNAVFVIAPADLPVQVRTSSAPVLRFATSAEFEQWRQGSAAQVATAVNAALDELKITLSACSPRTQEVIARLCERESVPSVKEMFALCSSRRSFYRSWSEDIGETPGAFLDRVRLMQLRAATSKRAAHVGTADRPEAVR
jgi:transcriptional regulator GlxA family with amidase domain